MMESKHRTIMCGESATYHKRQHHNNPNMLSPPSSHGHQVAIEGLVLSAQLSPVATLELIAAVLQVRSRR